MAHALVIGGTGMLKRVCQFLCTQNYTVSVVARNTRRLNMLQHASVGLGPAVNAIACDYKDIPQLKRHIQNVISRSGPLDAVICWVRTADPEIPKAIAPLVKEGGQFFHILNHTAADPANPAPDISSDSEMKHLDYHRVVLGFIKEAYQSRWLTNDEISKGVIDAIRRQTEEYIVGSIHPWEDRP